MANPSCTRRAVCLSLLGLALAGPAWAQHTLTGALPTPAGQSARPTVLVAGATGRSGRQVLQQLRESGRFEIRALARDPAKAARDLPGPYTWVAGDVTRPASLASALEGAQYVICTIGATERSGPNGPEAVDFNGVRNLVTAARDAGVRQFVLESSAGAGSGGGLMGWFLNLATGDVLVWKAKGEAAVRASGVPYTIVRPGGLTDEPGGRAGIAVRQGDQEFGRIPRADVAAVLIGVLDLPGATGKTFEVATDTRQPVDAWRREIPGLRADGR